METGKVTGRVWPCLPWLGIAPIGLEEVTASVVPKLDGVTCFVAAASPSDLRLVEMSSRNPVPIVNIRVLKNAQLSAAMLLFLVLDSGSTVASSFTPLRQNILGLTPTKTGLILFPAALLRQFPPPWRPLMAIPAQIAPRTIIVTGLSIFLVQCFGWQVCRHSSANDAQTALILRAPASVAVHPINIAAFSTLKGARIARIAMMNLSALVILWHCHSGHVPDQSHNHQQSRHGATHVPGSLAMTQGFEGRAGLSLARLFGRAGMRAAKRALEGRLNLQAASLAFSQSSC